MAVIFVLFFIPTVLLNNFFFLIKILWDAIDGRFFNTTEYSSVLMLCAFQVVVILISTFAYRQLIAPVRIRSICETMDSINFNSYPEEDDLKKLVGLLREEFDETLRDETPREKPQSETEENDLTGQRNCVIQ